MAHHFQGPLRDLNRSVFERRCALYTQVATLIAEHERIESAQLAAALVARVRVILRGGLAFLDRPTVRELERLEALRPRLGEGGLDAALRQELRDRLDLVHLQLANLLRSAVGLEDFRNLAALDGRLEQRQAEELRLEQVQARAKALEEECQQLEGEARAQIAGEDFPKAARTLRRAIRLDPRRAVLRNDLGVVLSLLGKTEEAVAEYRAAIALNEQEPARRTEEWTTSYYNLGVALRKLAQATFRAGDVERGREGLASAGEALRAYLELIEAEGGGARASRRADAEAALAEIERRLGARPEAEAPAS